MNDERDNTIQTMTFDGITADISFIWHGGADQIIVTPPDGYICLPSCERLVEESFNWTIYLLPYIGM